MSHEVQLTSVERSPKEDQLNYVMGLLSQEHGDDHLRIGEEFFPTSLLSPEERESELHVHGYNSLKGNSEYLQAAMQSSIVLHPMDAGLGTSVNRTTYLKELEDVLWNREFLDGQLGAKSMDLYHFWEDLHTFDRFMSVADIKIHRAIHQSKKFGATEIEVLVNEQSLGPMQGIYELHRDALLAAGIKVSFKVEDPLPMIRRSDGQIDKAQKAPGGHGYAGRLILDEIRLNKPNRAGRIHAIYNGDGINNGVSPEMVGFMKEKKAAFVMLTTTRTPADVKGGLIGLKTTKSKRVPGIMELAQAEETKQTDTFMKAGVSDDTEIAGLKHYKGEQYFNTNTVLMNEDLLHDFLKRIYDEMGEESYNRIVSPEFMKKKTVRDGVEYYQPEGALGSLVLRLNEEVQTNEKLKEMWKGISGDSEFLQIVNLEPENRDEFFTPVKHSIDYILHEYSDRYYLESDPSSDRYATLVNMSKSTHPQIEGDLINSKTYYGSVWNLVQSFGFARMRELASLDIRGAVVCPDAIWKGNVRIASEWKGISSFILNREVLKNHLGQYGDGPLVLENIEIIIDSMGNMSVRPLDAVKTN